MVCMMFEQFFQSETKTRVVKFFLQNSTKFYEAGEVANRLMLPRGKVLTQLKQLKKEGFVKSRSARSFSISYGFPYMNELKALAVKFPSVSDQQILHEAKRLKKLAYLLIGGELIHAQKGRVEVLIVVGDRIQERSVESFMRTLEAYAARELRYTVLTSKDFLYRIKMFDRFVLDALEYPHRILVNKLKKKGT